MELFEINYFDRAMALFKEAFSFKKYKLMAAPFAVVTAIVFLPLQIASLLLGVMMLLSALFLRINLSLTTGWHKVVTNEGQIVKHATQVVVSFFSWPFILFIYVLSGVYLSSITMGYLTFGCISYIWTLGGIKFKAFIGDSSDDCAVVKTGRYPVIIPTIFTIVTGIIMIGAPIVAACVIYSQLVAYNALGYGFFMPDFISAVVVCAGIELAFASLYSFFAYARFPKE